MSQLHYKHQHWGFGTTRCRMFSNVIKDLKLSPKPIPAWLKLRHISFVHSERDIYQHPTFSNDAFFMSQLDFGKL